MQVDQILLPFAEKEYVDVKRASRILGVKWQAVVRLYDKGLIEMLDYRARSRKRVRYQSIVDLCDNLRTKYSIADRRPPLSAPWLRHRDEDLLPFPLTDTMSTDQALIYLGYEDKRPVMNMIEEGRFEAYQLSEDAIWRISRQSFAAYLAAVHRRSRHQSVNTSPFNAAV